MSIVERAYHALLHWREVLHDVKLHRAGMRRVAPYGARGRTYGAVPGIEIPKGGHTQAARVKVVPTLSARHFHADTGKWENLGVIVIGEEEDGQS